MKLHYRLALLLLTLALGACGWELRGDYDLPAELTHIDLRAQQPDHPLVLKFERALKVAGVDAQDSGAATAVLNIGKINRELRNVAVDSRGRASEKGLWLSVAVSAMTPEGEMLLQQTTLSTNRIYRYDPNNVVAKDEEEQLIEQELYDNLVGQLMRRLRRIDTNKLINTNTPSAVAD